MRHRTVPGVCVAGVLGIALLACLPWLVPSARAQSRADDEGARSARQGGEPANGKEKKVCKNMVVTGSRMGRRVCRTPAQWQELELATRRSMREMDAVPVGADRPAAGSTGPGS